jgi:hypothetical protein
MAKRNLNIKINRIIKIKREHWEKSKSYER